nr:carbonic anhydrase [Candidatus Obscuribacter sp.]
GLLYPEQLDELPVVKAWLSHADATRRIVKENYELDKLEDDEVLSIAIQENVLVQIENLKTHPSVAAGLARGQLNLHGWAYKIQTGEVFTFNPKEGQFLPLTEVNYVREKRRPKLNSGVSI